MSTISDMITSIFTYNQSGFRQQAIVWIWARLFKYLAETGGHLLGISLDFDIQLERLTRVSHWCLSAP